MERVTNSYELMQRLVQASGEEIAASGWGTLGMKNILVGVTPTALFLEFVSFSMKTRQLQRIPFDELEFIHAASGDTLTPKMLKMNLEARISDAMTGTLMFKTLTGGLTSITFRKMPRFKENDKAPFRITEYITEVKPSVVHLPDLSTYRQKQSFGGCMKNFFLISAICTVILVAALGFGSGKWDMAFFAGLGTGVVLGAVFAPLMSVFKRIFSGRG